MARGQAVEVGATRVSQNGYHYTKVEKVPGTEKPGWRLTHHIIAEKKLGRPLREDERVEFIGKKSDLRPDNIRIVERGQGSVRRRIAQLEARRDEINAELAALRAELAQGRKVNHSK